ncbi:hypothetical protein WN55_00691 [Dufourea novaeangliae]|uniref:Uncharacterized protein n=1 Tax=Dufourea novaeangliae TaxID=178035 RepID=A0A154NY65_DUFNO|nr:hypothetical protein WN55_00691 [Dufourea novaeangliae]
MVLHTLNAENPQSTYYIKGVEICVIIVSLSQQYFVYNLTVNIAVIYAHRCVKTLEPL